MQEFMINLIGILLIALIVWWFLLAKPKAKRISEDIIDIIVDDGVYNPAIIKASKGQTIKLRFIRKDPSPCAQVVIFSDFNKSAELPLAKPKTLSLQLTEAGEFEFTCQMAMYRGTLIVE